MLVAHRPGHGSIEQAHMPGTSPAQETERMHLPDGPAAPGLSWNFNKIPVSSPDRPDGGQPNFSLTAPSLLPGTMQTKPTVGRVNGPLQQRGSLDADLRIGSNETPEEAKAKRTAQTVPDLNLKDKRSARASGLALDGVITPNLTVHGGQYLERKARADVSNSSMGMTTQFVGSPPTFTNWGPALQCMSPLFAVTAQVAVPPAMADGDLTVGFMQAVVHCSGPKGHYWDANDAPYMTAFQPYASLPLRDGDPNGVFYGPEAQRVVDSPTVSVSMSDQPQAVLLWTTPDGMGQLQQVIGEQQFVTWLVVKSDSTGEIDPLHYITWSVNWFAAVDQSTALGTPLGVGTITEYGETQGPLAPIRSGPAANNSILPTQWERWA
jgi:hypothetical protein